MGTRGGLGRVKGQGCCAPVDCAGGSRWVWAPGRMDAQGPGWAAPRPAGAALERPRVGER